MTTKFAEKIYKQLRRVPKGRVTTYKELAKSVNSRAYRAVGTALRNNPYAPQTPCHRVVSSDGSIGGFKGFTIGSTIDEKIEMLKNEDVEVDGRKVRSFEKVLFKF